MRIFLADDDRLIRMGLQKILTREKEEYEIVGMAANGKEAIEGIERSNPDLLITDVKMPIMDGIQLIKELKKRGLGPKIIALSGYGEYQFVRNTLKNGAADYLLKPVDRQELLDLVAAIQKDIQSEKIEDMSPKHPEVFEGRLEFNSDYRVIALCKQYVEEHFAEKIVLSSVAQSVNLSESYFSTYFKNKTGETFFGYLSRIRIEKAKEILTEHPEKKIYEVGAEVGYEEMITFNRNFKKVVGLSPREYCRLMHIK